MSTPMRYLRPSVSLSLTNPVAGAATSEIAMMSEESVDAVPASNPSCVSRKVL